jgi:hypothetical protein
MQERYKRYRKTWGLRTTSFPQLGIYGDQLTLYDHSTRRKDRPAKVLFQADFLNSKSYKSWKNWKTRSRR